MSRITFTDEEQEIIRQAPALPQRNRGANYIDRSGVHLTKGNTGFVVDVAVGKTLGTNGDTVWRAVHEATGEVILLQQPLRPFRIRFPLWIQSRDVVIYTMWICMLTRCYQTICNSFSSYGGRGVRVTNEWMPGGVQREPSTSGSWGSAEERAVAFEAFRSYVASRWQFEYGLGTYPCYDANGDSPQMSRRKDLGNYDRSTDPLTLADHYAAAATARAHSKDPGLYHVGLRAGLPHHRARYYDGRLPDGGY